MELNEVARPKHGYHLTKITKGVIGEFSKIREEFEEAADAYQQGNVVMLLCEFSDMIGAIERLVEKYIPGVKLEDILKQTKATKQAFDSGARRDRSD